MAINLLETANSKEKYTRRVRFFKGHIEKRVMKEMAEPSFYRVKTSNMACFYRLRMATAVLLMSCLFQKGQTS